MKRLLLLCLTYIMCVGNHQMAAQDSSESPGIFNSSSNPQLRAYMIQKRK